MADDIQNLGPNLDQSIDPEDQHVNPNDLSAARPLKQAKKDETR